MIKIFGIKEEYNCDELRSLNDFLIRFTKGVNFPCEVKETGEFDETGEAIVMLPNKNTMSLCYLKHEKCQDEQFV